MFLQGMRGEGTKDNTITGANSSLVRLSLFFQPQFTIYDTSRSVCWLPMESKRVHSCQMRRTEDTFVTVVIALEVEGVLVASQQFKSSKGGER